MRAALQPISVTPTGNMPAPSDVVALRSTGTSWSMVARALGCSIATARRACQKGVADQVAEVRETAMAA